jgi:polyferredoxin
MKRYAALRGKKITEVAPEAMKLLLNHDYRLANIRELEQAMERAVTLTKDDRIWAHHIFLGAPATETDHSYVNLLAWPRFRRMVLENRYPRLGQNITAAIFVTLITLCLFGPQDPVGNPALAVVWGIWWPLMFFSFVWIGRSWCSICAYATFARFAKRLRSPEIKLPGWVREYDAFLMAGGFLLVLWIEEVTGLRTSPRGTGFLMLSMFSLAIVAAYLFRRESWCRYLCPLGGMIGVCSMCSILEVRPNADVCINQCQTHDCYQGTPAVPGCPTFEHLAFVDNNQTCKLCLNCTRSCPHDAVMVNFRIPGREIWMMNKVRDRMSAFVCVLLGAALPALWLQAFKIQPAAAGMVGAYTAAQIGFPILAALALWAPNLLAPAGEEGTGWKRFWMTGYAYVPLAVAAHLSYRLRHVMGDNPTWLVLQTPKGVEVTATLVQPFQLTAVLLGGIYSIFCLWRVRHRREGRDFEASPAYWRAHGLVLAGYGAMVTALILAGE